MSYASSSALQAAIYQRLMADSAVDALVGSAIYDAVPPGPLPPTYISLGPEDVRDRSDLTGSGAEHDFTVSVVTEAAGFQGAKAIAMDIGMHIRHRRSPLCYPWPALFVIAGPAAGPRAAPRKPPPDLELDCASTQGGQS